MEVRRQTRDSAYSCRNASTGSMRAARLAGYSPKTSPIPTETSRGQHRAPERHRGLEVKHPLEQLAQAAGRRRCRADRPPA